MTIKEIRHLTGLSQRDFAQKYGIPVRSIENWETENISVKRQCPHYVELLLERVVRIDFSIPEETKAE